MKISKRSLVIIAAIAVMSCIAAYSFLNYERHDDLLKVDVVPFELTDKTGWGYEIKVDHKTFVRQESIPAIAGDRPFGSKEDAKKTGELVVRKLIKGNLPSLSAAEVIALGVAR